MKQSISGGRGRGRGGGGGGCLRIPNEEEVEAVEILLALSNSRCFIWGKKKQRSVLVSKSRSSPSTYHVPRTEKSTAVDAEKSPSTPLCFLPSGSGSDGADKPSSLKKSSKKKATDDMMERYNEMQQEREILTRKIEAMGNLHQELVAENLELKAKRQKLQINYSRNIEDIQLSNNPMKMNLDEQHYHQQITMFAPPRPPPQQQYMVDPSNGKVVAMACSSNSNTGGRFAFFNQIDPRVKIHGETFDFMASSQPSDQSKYMVMDNDLRVRTAAAARKRRIMRMKENKTSFLAMKLSRACR